jgi:hypothetical protein
MKLTLPLIYRASVSLRNSSTDPVPARPDLAHSSSSRPKALSYNHPNDTMPAGSSPF